MAGVNIRAVHKHFGSTHVIRGVVFGHGSIEQALTANEFFAIDQVEAASEMFELVLTTRE